MADKTFEQKFAQLAEVHVKEKVPSLMDSWKGFQLLHKEEDEESATGIMAFVLNELWVYIPVIFLKGDIKGDNILYIQNVDLCIPAQDNWINTLKEKGMGFLGSIADELDDDTDFETAQDIDIPVEEFAIKEASDSVIGPDALNKLLKRRPFSDKSFVEKLATMGDQAVITFANTLTSNVDAANAVLTHHPPQELQKLSSIMTDISARNKRAEVTDTKLTYIHGMEDKYASELSDSEKKVLVKQGLFIKDAREETSKVFTTASTESKLSNPNQDGNYSVLMKNGDYKDFYIIMCSNDKEEQINPSSNLPSSAPMVDSRCILIDKDNGVGKKCLVSEVYAEQSDDKELPSFKEATYRNLVEALNKENTCIVLKQDKNTVDVEGENYSTLEGDDKTRIMVRHNYNDVEPVFTGTKGKLSIHRDTLIIPEDTKMFTFRNIEWRDRKEYNLGDLDTVSAALQTSSKFVPVSIKSDDRTGTTVRAGEDKEEYVDKTAALHCMTDKLGIFAGQAQQMLKEAERSGKPVEYFVKLAAPYEEGVGVVNPLKAPMTDTREEVDSNPDMNAHLPGTIVGQLTAASQSGLSEVFDTSVFQSLLQSAGVSDFKQEFVVDMIRGMDSAARLLLLLYWNYEMFEERYEGKLEELEEKLKQLFTTSGDVVLFIKEKTESLPDGGESVWGMLSETL